MTNILSKPSEDVLRAFLMLQESNNPSFKIIIEWLKECRKAEEICYDRFVDKDLLWSQGRHQVLFALIDASDSVRDTLKKQLKK